MPRRSSRSDDVADNGEAGTTRRNPRRGNKPVVYEESHDVVVEEEDDVVDIAEDDSSDNDEHNEDDEPLVADESSEEEEKPKRSRGSSNKRKSPKNDDMSPPRKSSRSTKYTSSMAEPSESQGLLVETIAEAEDKKKPSKRTTKQKNDNDSHHKSPARRHAKKRLSIQPGDAASSDSDSDADDSEEEADDEEEEPLKVQRIIASRTERRSKWREICMGFNTSEIDDGSRWFQDWMADTDTDETFEERFLIKWSDLSFLHCSWECRKDLIDQVEGGKTYLSTFFRKSQDGYLYGPDERNDGDYFDPAYTQVDRILEIGWPDDVSPTGADEEANLKPEDVGVVMDKKNEEGTGRQFLVKWGNQPYSEATYEFERDLIWREVDYKPHVEAFLRRNSKPSKKSRREAIAQGKEELRNLVEIFCGKEDRTEEEHQQGIREFQENLQKLEFRNGGQLRDYQAEGVSWMLSNYVNNRSSILADEMGLGKTLQTVVTVNTVSTKVSPSGVFLVVAPLSTLAHWQREFEAWTDLNTIIYHGSADDRDHIRRYEMAYESDRPARVAFNSSYLKKCGPPKYNKMDSPWMVQVIITTPEMLTADDAAELMAIKYDMVIVDEAHRMKNRNSKLTSVLRDDRFSFHHKMLLTGTPIQNNVSEFWTLLNFCDEDAYDDLDDFLEKYGDMKDKETVDQLHEEIRPYILRRLKEDVEKSVPPKEETLIEVELTMPQKQYYRALYERNVKFLYKNKSKALDGPSLNNLAMQLRKCCNHVCLLNGVEEELRREHSGLSEAEFLVKGSGKLVLLDKLLPRLREEGHRVLLFSQFKIMLDLIEDYLTSRGMKMERIDGSITGQKRQQAIDRFQAKDGPKGSEPPFIMLLSTRAGGQGITLTAADTCIIFDSDWNPQNDLQAQARCHRIGQKSEVKVYRLISARSYEMQMFHLSSMKMGLDQAVLKGFEKGSANDGGMSKEEVERLLKHGAYDILNEDKAGTAEAASNEFIKQDIDSILAGRSRTVVHENTGSKSDAAGGTFSKASFQVAKTPGKEKNEGVEVDDPNFWAKILGEQHLKESQDEFASKKRQRNQTNYNEAAYQKQLEAALLADESDADSDSDSDDDDDGGHTDARVSWGIKKDGDWSLSQAELFGDCLAAFGYGNLEWSEITSRLRLGDKSLDEIKRMAFSMTLSCVVEATDTEILTLKRREDRTTNKSQDDSKPDDAGKLPPLTDKEIEESALKKFWDVSSNWTVKLLSDVVSYAKTHEARDHETLMEILHQKVEAINKEDIKILFAKNVWSSLRDRGWKVTSPDGAGGEQQYSYDDEKFSTMDEVLTAARKHHSDLSEAIDSVLKAIESSKVRTVEAQAEKRQKVLELSPSSVSLENLRNAIYLYSPAQLLSDRRKSHPKVKLTRKLLSSCSLMTSAFEIVKKAESLITRGSPIEKIDQCLFVDRRSSLPHPKWKPHHDAVLLHAITKHGWLESESSCRAITDDKEVVWGPPFDRSSARANSADDKYVSPAMIEAVANRACDFLNRNKQLLNSSKAFNPAGLVRTYWLEKHRASAKGDTLGDPAPHDENYSVNRKALLQEECADSSELSELPTRKELLKRAKTILTRAVISAGKSEEPASSRAKDHPYTVLDQSHPCNVFLAQLIRSMMKAPAGGELYKLLCNKIFVEAEARKADVASSGAASEKANDKSSQQQNEFDSIMDNIDTAKRSMSKSVRLGKNVLRAIIGEEPVQPKSPIEPLYPVSKARLKYVKPKQGSTSKSDKAASKKKNTDPRYSLADGAIAAARQKMGTDKSKTTYTVDLTEVETLIAQTAASYGIPVLTNDWKADLNTTITSESENKMSWVSFGRNLMIVANKRLEEAHSKQEKANKDYDSLEHKPNISIEKRDTIERTCYLAEQNYEAAEIATGQAGDYASEPETLAKKTIMTIAKLAKHAGQKKPDEDVGIRVYKWLPTQIEKWAAELELLDEHGKALTLTAVDFLKDLTEAERNSVQTVAAFDAQCCTHVMSQAALLSRLLSFLESRKNESDSLQAHIEQAALNVRENWDERPSWWSADNASFDRLLLDRLARGGFVGLLQTKMPFGMDASQAKVSYKSLGLQLKNLQARAAQLVRSIHDVEEQQDTPRTFFATSAHGKISTASSSKVSHENEEEPAAKKPKVSSG